MGAGYHTLHHTLYKDNYGEWAPPTLIRGLRAFSAAPSAWLARPLPTHTLAASRRPASAGQFFVFFDWVHDTLTPPREKDGAPAKAAPRSAGKGKAKAAKQA